MLTPLGGPSSTSVPPPSPPYRQSDPVRISRRMVALGACCHQQVQELCIRHLLRHIRALCAEVPERILLSPEPVFLGKPYPQPRVEAVRHVPTGSSATCGLLVAMLIYYRNSAIFYVLYKIRRTSALILLFVKPD